MVVSPCTGAALQPSGGLHEAGDGPICSGDAGETIELIDASALVLLIMLWIFYRSIL